MARTRSRFPAYGPSVDRDLQLFLEAMRQELERIGQIVDPPGTISVETIIVDKAKMDSLIVGAFPSGLSDPPPIGAANIAASLHIGSTYTAPGAGGLRTEGAITSESTITSTGLLTAQAGLTVTKDTGGTYDSTTVAATFGDVTAGQVDSVYIIGNTINSSYGYNSNNTSLWLNYRGYQGGVTRDRNVIIGDGKGVAIATFTGSSRSMTIAGPLIAVSINASGGLSQFTHTTEQLRIRYDANNYVSVTVSSVGLVTYAATGSGAAHSFGSQAVSMGALTATTVTASGLVYSQHGAVAGAQTPHLQWAKVGAPTAGNPYWGLLLTADAVPVSALQSWDGTTAVRFMEFDHGNTRLHLAPLGTVSVLVGTTTPATGSPKLDVVGPLANDARTVVLADKTTDATLKIAGVHVRHYTNAQSPLGMILGRADSATNRIFIGGGVSALNAATAIEFYTGATVTTTTGTLAADLTGVGSAAILRSVGHLRAEGELRAAGGIVDSVGAVDLLLKRNTVTRLTFGAALSTFVGIVSMGTLLVGTTVATNLLTGDVLANGGVFAISDAGPSNIDHIWNDDTLNRWHFVNDAARKATGNAGIQIGGTSTTGIFFGADVDLFRDAANRLKTSDDFVIGALQPFDSASTPDLDDVFRFNGTKWVPTTLTFRFTDGDVVAEVYTDGTASAHVHDGRALTGAIGATPSAPTVTAGYHAIIVNLGGVPPANVEFQIRWSTDGGVNWSDALALGLIKTTGDQVMHGQLDHTLTYIYQVRKVGSTTGSFSASSTGVQPSDTPRVNPFDLILASQIATIDLASVSANLGKIVAGLMENVAGTHGILVSGLMTDADPATWRRWINFPDETDYFIANYKLISDAQPRFGTHHDGTLVISDSTNVLFTITAAGTQAYWQDPGATQGISVAGAIPGGWLRYIGLDDANVYFIKHPKFEVQHDGRLRVLEGANTLFEINAAGTSAYWQNTAGTAGVNVLGTLPGGWTNYFNLNASGSLLKHLRGQWDYDGTVKMYGSSGRTVFNLTATAYQLQEDAVTPIRGVNIMGATPSGWDAAGGVYLNLVPGTGADLKFIRHDQFELRHSGTPLAIFRGVAQETDTSPKFKLDFPNKLLTVIDEQVTPRTRVKLGKIGATDVEYGLALHDESGTEIFRSWGNLGVNKIQMRACQIGVLGENLTYLRLTGNDISFGEGGTKQGFIQGNATRLRFAGGNIDSPPYGDMLLAPGALYPFGDNLLTLGTATSGQRWKALYLFDTDAALFLGRNSANVAEVSTGPGDSLILAGSVSIALGLGSSNQLTLNDANGANRGRVVVGGISTAATVIHSVLHLSGSGWWDCLKLDATLPGTRVPLPLFLEHYTYVQGQTDTTSTSFVASWDVAQYAGSVIRYAGTVNATVHGMTTSGNGSPRVLWIVNVTSDKTVSLAHDSASGNATERILTSTGASLAIGPREWAFAWYDNTTTKWRAVKWA